MSSRGVPVLDARKSLAFVVLGARPSQGALQIENFATENAIPHKEIRAFLTAKDWHKD